MTARLALLFLVVAALGVRAYELGQPIVRFHPTRHYRSAVLARACYYDHAQGISPQAKAVADANRDMQPAGELPLMEWIACSSYLAIGREEIAIPRSLASIFWVFCAAPVWWLTRRFSRGESGAYSALVAVTILLFLPYGIVASRNFQPDALMTLAALCSIVATIRFHDDPTRARLAVAAASIGVAGLIKPMSVFLTVPVVLALASSMRDATLVGAGLIAPVIYYGYSAVAGSLVQDQMRLRFVPHLLTTRFFWSGLATQISRVETVPVLMLAIAGAAVARETLARWLLLALFAGYAAFAAVFTYHMPTHDYYHLPYIAVVAIGAGVLVDRVQIPLARRFGEWPCAVVMLLTCTVAAIAGTLNALPRLRVDDSMTYQRMYEDIAGLAQHSTKVLFLDAEYGYSLMYHAQLSGDAWPNQDDLAAERFDGRAQLDAEARFARDYQAWEPEYFVITDLESFNASPDLQRLLDGRARAVRITNRYRVYEFRRPVTPQPNEQS